MGRSLFEAMASGKPVIVSRTNGAMEYIIDGNNGLLVPVGDHEKLAEKMAYIILNPTARKEIGNRGSEMFHNKYSQDKYVDRYIEMVKSIV